MYASRTTQIIVGVFVIVGIAALAFLSMRLGRIQIFPSPGYILYANFDNISGLKMGDRIEIAGVEVGKVVGLSLKNERARVSMRLNKNVEVDNEAIAAIKTSGIIGDKFISIAMGPGDKTLKNGDTIRQTESSFVLEDVIGQLINNAAAGGGGSKKTGTGGDSSGKSQKQ
jgi:phospholipid/cholesterol/gamma-HCH transport system substrate-binding protein